jgi:hypothetical protein
MSIGSGRIHRPPCPRIAHSDVDSSGELWGLVDDREDPHLVERLEDAVEELDEGEIEAGIDLRGGQNLHR